MARFRLSQPAQNDLANILATSAERWGTEGRRRYARLLAAAMRVVAANPEGPLTQARNELSPGLRSIHLRSCTCHRSPSEGKEASSCSVLSGDSAGTN